MGDAWPLYLLFIGVIGMLSMYLGEQMFGVKAQSLAEYLFSGGVWALIAALAWGELLLRVAAIISIGPAICLSVLCWRKLRRAKSTA